MWCKDRHDERETREPMMNKSNNILPIIILYNYNYERYVSLTMDPTLALIILRASNHPDGVGVDGDGGDVVGGGGGDGGGDGGDRGGGDGGVADVIDNIDILWLCKYHQLMRQYSDTVMYPLHRIPQLVIS